jgi:hypothetical protein
MFDGLRVKLGDMQFHVDEGFISRATSLSASRNKWFNNIKVENIPW